jgi:hypothetical protein
MRMTLHGAGYGFITGNYENINNVEHGYMINYAPGLPQEIAKTRHE